MEFPKFKYFPNPVEEGSIEASDKKCDCCGESRGYIYTGNMYARNRPEVLCPWCIYDGSAAKKYEVLSCSSG